MNLEQIQLTLIILAFIVAIVGLWYRFFYKKIAISIPLADLDWVIDNKKLLCRLNIHLKAINRDFKLSGAYVANKNNKWIKKIDMDYAIPITQQLPMGFFSIKQSGVEHTHHTKIKDLVLKKNHKHALTLIGYFTLEQEPPKGKTMPIKGGRFFIKAGKQKFSKPFKFKPAEG
ncbi:MAG: hypothetical protein ACFCBW_17865 [Candidatus Competibacterales bacterium]